MQKDLKEILGEERCPPMQKLQQEKKRLLDQKKEQYEAYRSVREEWLEIGKIINNRDSFLQKQNTAGRETRSNTDLELASARGRDWTLTLRAFSMPATVNITRNR